MNKLDRVAELVAGRIHERLAGEPAAKSAYYAVPNLNFGGYGERGGYLKSFETWMRYGPNAPDAVKAAMQEDTNSEGGFLVPDEYSMDLVEALQEESILRRAGARIIPMHRRDLNVPSRTDSTAAVLTAEEAAFSQVEPTVGEVNFQAYKYTKLSKVSEELLADSRFPIWERVLKPDFAHAFAQAENAAFTTGTGASQPQGCVTGAGVGVTAAAATTIKADEIIDLFHSLDWKYRARPTCKFMMADSTAQAIRKLKDGNGNYLWGGDLSKGQSETLLGKPVIINNSMAAIATTTKPILFADFDYYWIGDREEFAMKRLEELYAGNGQIGFRAYKRFDGHVMLAAAFKVLQMA